MSRKPNLSINGLKISQGNKKLVPNNETKFLIWNIKAIDTCPYSTELCRKYCYANKSEKMYKNTLNRNLHNTNETLRNEFTYNMILAIEEILTKKCYVNAKQVLFRIHESGDFYSYEYFKKWVDISNYFKGSKIIFQCYTKSITYVNRYLIEEGKKIEDINIKILFSQWEDTNEYYVNLAKKIGLNTYTAMDKEDLHKAVETKKVLKCRCEDCGNCKLCYLHNVTIPIVCEKH